MKRSCDLKLEFVEKNIFKVHLKHWFVTHSFNVHVLCWFYVEGRYMYALLMAVADIMCLCFYMYIYFLLFNAEYLKVG